MASEDPNGSPETLGRIALKQVRVSRAEVEARAREATNTRGTTNPMNRLVPYLDLFSRLSDEELARLARTPLSAAESLRLQIEEVNRALGRFADLLPRLSDEELARLTGGTVKTIRFWRLTQPRHLQGHLQGDIRRRSNADTPAQENVPVHRHSEDSDLTSESSMSNRQRPEVTPEQPSGEDPDAAESSTFVIDTIE
jgi:pantothenate kinase-related protein Tda10